MENDGSRLILLSTLDSSNSTLYNTNPVVDIATMENNLTSVHHVCAKNISLQAIDVSYATFREMFYNTNNSFQPNLNVIVQHSNLLRNNKQQKVTEHGAGREPFNLFNDVMEHYETDLSLPRNCWSACSLTNMERTIANQKTLFDVGGSCNIPCSMTLDEFFNALEDQGVKLNGERYVNAENTRVPTNLTKKVIAVVTAVYKSATANVSDIAVTWPYLIDFRGISARNCELAPAPPAPAPPAPAPPLSA